MTQEADRELVAKLKARLALAALRGERTPAELAEQFRRIDEWAAQLEQDSRAATPRPKATAGPVQVVLDPPAPAPAPTLPAILQAPVVPQMPARPKAPTLPAAWPPTLPQARPPSRIPTLPQILQAPVVPQMPVRPKAPTLPAMRPPTLPAMRPPTLPVFHGQPQWPEVPQSPTWPEPALGDALDDDFWENRLQRAGEQAGDSAATAPASPRPGAVPAPRPRRHFRPLFVGWRERHHAARTSRQLLKLHRKLAAAHPGLSKQQLYRLIVMARLGSTAQAADAVLSRAAESFATWPVERALTFRDVVHYLAVSDYLGADAALAQWTRENLGRVVAEFVPDTM